MDARTTLDDAWPLFGLRLRSERLVLRMPTDDDLMRLLPVARAGIHPPDEMPFGVVWSTLPSPAFERGFMQHHWRTRGTWSPDALVPEPHGRAGWASRSARSRSTREAFAVHRTVHTGSWLGHAVPGPWATARRCARRSWLSPSMASARSSPRRRRSRTTRPRTASRDRSATSRTGSGSLAPEGVARETQRFRMTVERWRSRAARAGRHRGPRRLPRDVRDLTPGA